jgi:ribulose-phosphate 3-epimerase
MLNSIIIRITDSHEPVILFFKMFMLIPGISCCNISILNPVTFVKLTFTHNNLGNYRQKFGECKAMVLIGPSVMCADWGNLGSEIEMLDRGGVDFYHFDIMDGQFVPNFTMGPDLLKTLRAYTEKPFDIHMMVEEPERYIDMFADAGANWISVHAESKTHLQRALQQIRSRGLKAGVALNPSTPLSFLEYVFDVTDYVCLMTVNPGFARQSFIPSMHKKISDLKDMVTAIGAPIEIQVDGNISYESIPKVVEQGASLLVCGTSSLFMSNNLQQAASDLKIFVNNGFKQPG